MEYSIPTQQAQSLYRRKIGSTVVTSIVDGSETFSFDILSPNITAEDAKRLLMDAGLPPIPSMPVNAYVVQDGRRTVLIDAGDANCMGTGGRLHQVLAAADIKASDVNTILLTHAHPDHVGGLTVGDAPLFPNAELIVHTDEVRYWRGELNTQPAARLQKDREFACKTFDIYKSALRLASGGEVVPGITLQPFPGHTPGHSGYLIESGGDALLIWGDIVHWPDIQIPRPDVTLTFDVDPVQMVQTRQRVLEMAASENILVGGMHLNFPGFIHVVKDRKSYAIREEERSLGLS